MQDIVEILKRYIPLRVELENGIPPERAAAMHEELTEIEKLIDTLNDPLERLVLRLRYLEGDSAQAKPMKWDDVAKRLYRGCCEGKRWALHRIHTSALANLSAKEESHP